LILLAVRTWAGILSTKLSTDLEQIGDALRIKDLALLSGSVLNISR